MRRSSKASRKPTRSYKMRLRLKLRPYQENAYKFLTQRLRAALFMVQRSGKTPVTLKFFCWLYHTRGVRRFLVVCPLSVVAVWEEQIREHIEGHIPIFLAPEIPTTDSYIWVIHYEWLVRNYKLLKKHAIQTAVSDESHRIKNRNAKQSKRLWHLCRELLYKVILTGTPYGKSQFDFWAQFRFMNEQIWGTRFATFFEDYGKTGGFMGLKKEFHKELEPRLMRTVQQHAFYVSRKDVGLKDPVITKLHFDLSKKERKHYETLEQELILQAKNWTVTTPLGVSQMMKLRQMTSGFVIDDEGVTREFGDSKIKLLKDYLTNDATGNQKAFFCNFRHELAQIEDLLEELGHSWAEIRGHMHPDRRTEAWKGFRSGKYRDIVCQIQSGGVGLDFSAADESIFFSTNYSLLDYDQAKARMDSVEKNLLRGVTHLIANKTMDVVVYKALVNNDDIAKRVLGYLKS